MKLNKKQKKIIGCILYGLIIFVPCNIALHFIQIAQPFDLIVKIIVNLAACTAAGYPLVIRTAKTITKGQIFDENFLMLIAVVGAFLTSQFDEAFEVLIFYQVGQLFENYSVSSSRDSISSLMKMFPDEAAVLRNGEEETVSPDEIEEGETVIIRPGERIPVDCTITKGSTAVDTSALTGESLPVERAVGDTVLSGSINLSGAIEASCDKAFEDSTASKILELVEEAAENKSEAENFVSKFAKYYTPVVVIFALLVAFVPPLFTAVTGGASEFVMWIKRALIFLVVSCPCAVVISVPLAFFGTIGGASKDGILIKGSSFVESLAKTDTVVLDKTGTLTEGRFSVAEVICPEGLEREEVLSAAAAVEYYSNHPVAAAIKKAADSAAAEEVREFTGLGVSGIVDGRRVLCGKYSLMQENNIECREYETAGTAVYVAADGRYMGCIILADKLKADSLAAVSTMREESVQKIIMLTGDNERIASEVAEKAGIDGFFAGLLPSDKVERLSGIKQTAKGTVLFAGDGMNDAPCLAAADTGVAMGALGSDAAIEAADVVIMNDSLAKIPEALRYSRKCMRIVWGNVVFAIGIKVLVLVLAALGHANMIMGIFADVGVSIICILNSMRTLKKIRDR